MAYVKIPKDLTKVKNRFMFGLTRRQIVFFLCGAAVALPLFFIIKESAGVMPASLTMILALLPFFLFAMYEKNGMYLENIIYAVIRQERLRPKKRKYVPSCIYGKEKRKHDGKNREKI